MRVLTVSCYRSQWRFVTGGEDLVLQALIWMERLLPAGMLGPISAYSTTPIGK